MRQVMLCIYRQKCNQVYNDQRAVAPCCLIQFIIKLFIYLKNYQQILIMIAAATFSNSPRFLPAVKIEDDKKCHQVYRRIYQDAKRLTEYALHACKELHINPDDLLDKTPEDFSHDPHSNKSEVPKEIVDLRYNHYQSKRRKNFETIARALGLWDNPALLGGKLAFKGMTKRRGGFLLSQTSRWGVRSPGNVGRQNNSLLAPLPQNNFLGIPKTSQLPQINSKQQLNINDDTESHISKAVSGTSIKKVGRVQFGLLSPTSATGMKLNNNFRSQISSPENFNKVNTSLMKLQMRMNKEQQRVERFKQVRNNAMIIAEQTVTKFQQRINKDMVNQKKYQELISQKVEEQQHLREKHYSKLRNAQLNYATANKKLDQKSLSGYTLQLKQVADIINKRVQKDRQHSQRQFESLRHTLDDEAANQKRRSEMRKKEYQDTDRSLSEIDRKLSRGQSNAEYYKRETSSRASRVSQLQQEAYREYQSLCESRHSRSLDKVIRKENVISSKMKKKNEICSKKAKGIQEDLEHRFERSRSARSHVSEEIKKQEKMIIDRITQKDRLKQILLERQQLEHLKHKELNALRKADHQDQYNKEHAMLQEFKSRVIRKVEKLNSQRQDIETNLRLLYQASPQKDHVHLSKEERQVLNALNPRQVFVRERLNLTLQYSGQVSPKAARNQKKKMFGSDMVGGNHSVTR